MLCILFFELMSCAVYVSTNQTSDFVRYGNQSIITEEEKRTKKQYKDVYSHDSDESTSFHNFSHDFKPEDGKHKDGPTDLSVFGSGQTNAKNDNSFTMFCNGRAFEENNINIGDSSEYADVALNFKKKTDRTEESNNAFAMQINNKAIEIPQQESIKHFLRPTEVCNTNENETSKNDFMYESLENGHNALDSINFILDQDEVSTLTMQPYNSPSITIASNPTSKTNDNSYLIIPTINSTVFKKIINLENVIKTLKLCNKAIKEELKRLNKEIEKIKKHQSTIAELESKIELNQKTIEFINEKINEINVKINEIDSIFSKTLKNSEKNTFIKEKKKLEKLIIAKRKKIQEIEVNNMNLKTEITKEKENIKMKQEECLSIIGSNGILSYVNHCDMLFSNSLRVGDEHSESEKNELDK